VWLGAWRLWEKQNEGRPRNYESVGKEHIDMHNIVEQAWERVELLCSAVPVKYGGRRE
jgi:hypothetical protein